MNEQSASHRAFSSAASASRWRKSAPLISGAALAAIGLSRRSKAGLALAAAGGTIALLGWQANASEAADEFLARGSVLLNCSAEEAYRRWHNFEDLPRFMYHLKSVTKTADRQYRWVAYGPAGIPVEWDAEIVDERANEFISWRSLPGSMLMAAGSVRFEKAQADRGIILTAITHFNHPAGKLGYAISKLFGKDPDFLMQQDLRRFKALVETGEIPTIEGQPHGPRSLKVKGLRMANPDRPQLRRGATTEILEEQRRTA